MAETPVLHEYSASGNCYKIRLTAAHLGLSLDRREYDILKGGTRTPEFLANVNANGRIPVLQVGPRFIPESNAACFYLGDGSPLVPQDRFERADMLRWMSSNNIAMSRTSRPCASGWPLSANRTSPISSALCFRASARRGRPP
ncbi:MAG TPA: glutathione S-transferase N-terminal domain-containing protein [Allosphingosinicella sp.]|nr:glutathione S-transferase N-terminal domain-containing protein [Allosphingosinicella sp.]